IDDMSRHGLIVARHQRQTSQKLFAVFNDERFERSIAARQNERAANVGQAEQLRFLRANLACRAALGALSRWLREAAMNLVARQRLARIAARSQRQLRLVESWANEQC